MKRHLGDKPSHNSCPKVDSSIMQSNELGDGDTDTHASGKSENYNDASRSDTPNYSTKKLEQIKGQIVSALSQAQSSSAIKALKLQLRLDHPKFTAQEIDDLWKAIAQETNDAEEQAYLINDQLPTLMQVKQQRLVLADYLWGDKGRLAAQLTAIAAVMPIAPEFLLTTLISTAESHIGTET